jgi:peptidoglycan/LPS O-acetylase OafA/YrhL
MTERPRAPAGYWRPELDVLRFVAFFAVFVHHATGPVLTNWIELSGSAGIKRSWLAVAASGEWGVDLFFCLSAFLITEILRREYERSGRIDILAFWVRRALRIWPLYFTFLAFAALLVPRILPGDFISGWYLVAFLGFLGNWITALWGYPASVAAPLWSVSIEEQFYFAWPAAILWTRFSRRRALWLCGSLVVVSWAARLLLVIRDARHPAIWCTTFARLDPIALGALASILLRGRLPAIGRLARAALGFGGFGGFIAMGALGSLTGAGALVTYPLVALFSLMLLVAFLGVRLPANPLFGCLTFLGRISYGLYVFHIFAIAWLSRLLVSAPAGLVLAATFCGTVALAMLSWYLLERPFLELKTRFARI